MRQKDGSSRARSPARHRAARSRRALSSGRDAWAARRARATGGLMPNPASRRLRQPAADAHSEDVSRVSTSVFDVSSSRGDRPSSSRNNLYPSVAPVSAGSPRPLAPQPLKIAADMYIFSESTWKMLSDDIQYFNNRVVRSSAIAGIVSNTCIGTTQGRRTSSAGPEWLR